MPGDLKRLDGWLFFWILWVTVCGGLIAWYITAGNDFGGVFLGLLIAVGFQQIGLTDRERRGVGEVPDARHP